MTEIITTVDAEIVVPMDHAAAKRLDQRIRLLVGTINENIAKLHDLVDEAKRGDVHVALGYSSWTAYLSDVFTVTVRLDRDQRRELVGYLSGEGMSQRAIADVVGVDQKTVSNDVRAREEFSSPDPTPAPVTGLDGKTYRPKPKLPRGEGSNTDVLAELVKTVTACAVGAQFVDPGSVDRDVLIQHAATVRDCLNAIHDAVDRWGVDE